MNPETSQFLELLEQRIALLGLLASSLVLARQGIVALDMDGLEQRIQEQQNLCAEICTVDEQIDRIQKACAARLALPGNTSLTPALDASAARLQETLARLATVQLSVKRLNSEHQSLFSRRSRRTVGALLNSYHSFALTYSEPGAPQSSVGGPI